MTDLVVKAVYNADTKQLVAGADQATAATDKTTAAATRGAAAQDAVARAGAAAAAGLKAQGQAAQQAATATSQAAAASTAAGTAAGSAAPKFDAAAIAYFSQAKAAEQAAAALGLSGKARDAEIARLSKQAAAATGTIESVRAMSAAHAEYNATVVAAKEALDRGELSEDRYAAVVAGATSKLALANVELRKMEGASGGAGKAIGFTRFQMQELTYAGRHLAEEVAAGIPPQQMLFTLVTHLSAAFGDGASAAAVFNSSLFIVGGTVALTAAAIGVSVVAAEAYAASVREVDVALLTHTQRLVLTKAQYAALAAAIAETADISNKQSRAFEAQLISNRVDPTAWKSATETLRGYAVAMGQDIPTAGKMLAEGLAKPSDALKRLQKDYDDISDSQVQWIEHLETSGRVAEAQRLVADQLREHYAKLKDETDALSRGWDAATTSMGNFFDQFGNAIRNAMGGDFKDLAVFIAMLEGAPPPPSTASWNVKGKRNDPPWIKTSSVFGATPHEASAMMGLPAPGDLIGDTLRQYDSYDAQLTQLRARRQALQDAIAGRGAVATGSVPDDSEVGIRVGQGRPAPTLNPDDRVKAGKALAAVNLQIALAEKAHKGQLLSLDYAGKQWEERVRALILQAPQQIAGVDQQTRYFQQQAQAVGVTTLSLRDLQHANEIAQAQAPYLAALEHARGNEAIRLKKAMDDLTASIKARQIAEDAAAARNDIVQQFAAIQGDYAKAIKDAKEWREATVAAMTAAQDAAVAAGKPPPFADIDELYRQVDEVFNKKLADAYADDLRRRRDWSAGSIRALHDLTQATNDWAATSADLTQSMAQEFQAFATGSEHSLDNLGKFIEQWVLKLLYQRFVAAQVNYAVGGLVDLVGAVLGVGGADNLVQGSKLAGAPSLGSGIGSDIGGVLVGQHHLGIDSGSFAYPRTAVNDNPALYVDAPRHHEGYNLQPGEHRAIVRNDETIRTPEQEVAHAASLMRAGAAAAPVINFKPVNNTGTPLKITEGKKTPSGQGGYDQEFFIDLVEKRLVDRQSKGQSAFGDKIALDYGLSRKVR